MQQEQADGREIVIAGAGLAGLAVALGLHRYTTFFASECLATCSNSMGADRSAALRAGKD